MLIKYAMGSNETGDNDRPIVIAIRVSHWTIQVLLTQPTIYRPRYKHPNPLLL